MNETPIRVLIAEDMEPLRRLYVKIVSQAEDMEVTADVGTGEMAVRKALDTTPDVILMDIEMEKKDAGLRAVEEIYHAGLNPKIIILTVYEEDELIFTAFQLGVCDYLMKNSSKDEILNSIRNAYHNNLPLRPELASKILGEFKRVKSYETSFLYAVNIVSSLTSTELELLRLLLDGKSRREICELRHVEISTVKTQIHHILKKFNKNSIEEVSEMIESLNLYDLIYRPKNKLPSDLV